MFLFVIFLLIYYFFFFFFNDTATTEIYTLSLHDALPISLSDKHTLVAEIPGDLPQAHGDAMAIDIMVGQLLENAFKYSPNGGTITVAAHPAGDWIEVTVDDEGIGIAPGDHERIFERFVQGETGDRRRFGGIGLGLYIVRQLARAQDGEVAAASLPGGGTRMSLQLRRAGPA